MVLLEDGIECAVPLLLHLLVLHSLHLLLLDLDQLLLHCSIACRVHRARKSRKALLLENIIHLAMLAPDVEEQRVLLFEDIVAQGAPEAVHEGHILLLQLLHEVPTTVLLKKLDASLLLTTDFTLKIIVTG